VLKVDSPSVVHKSRHGGVLTGLRNEQELAAAFERLAARFGHDGISWLLAEEKTPGAEFIVGARRMGSLGPVVMVGMGGLVAESLADISVGLAPLGQKEAATMLAELRGSQAFLGLTRDAASFGEAPSSTPLVDREALGEIVVRVAALVAACPEIAEMDINPVIAYPPGKEPVAVDVRTRLA